MTGALLPLFENIVPAKPSAPIAKPVVAEAPVVKPEPVAKVAPKPKPRSGVLPPLSVSIKMGSSKPTSDVKPEPTAEPVVASETPQVEYTDHAIDVTNMRNVWTDFASSQNSFVQQILRSSIPDLKGEHIIILSLENSFQEEKLDEIKPILLPFLREKLNNSKISLEVTISEGTTSQRAFSPKEKLEEMMKENAVLAEMIQILDLDLG